MNSNPLEARLARRRKRKPGDMKALQAKVWTALEAASDLLESESLDERLRACHAVFQGATAYAKVLQVGELEARLNEVEAAVKAEDARRAADAPRSWRGAA